MTETAASERPAVAAAAMYESVQATITVTSATIIVAGAVAMAETTLLPEDRLPEEPMAV